jgi:hypothetical protein
MLYLKTLEMCKNLSEEKRRICDNAPLSVFVSSNHFSVMIDYSSQIFHAIRGDFSKLLIAFPFFFLIFFLLVLLYFLKAIVGHLIGQFL